MPEFNSNLLSRKEAARYLGLHYQTLSNWAQTGENDLMFLKIGRRCWYRKSDLDSWIKTRERTQT